jgi:hypothetical protein
MTAGRTREDLFQFIDYLGDKGLMPAKSVAARKTVATKVLGILNDEEAQDVLALDLDLLMQRFSNLHGKNYTPNSLRDYNGRLRGSIEDFRSYVSNPLGFRPSTRARSKPNDEKNRSVGKEKSTPIQPSSISSNPSAGPAAPPSANILPIALRANLIVQIAGLPFDLTQAEAKKIANIILAHALSE